jgi:Fe2+ or Zn2+ uptake regulation protein
LQIDRAGDIFGLIEVVAIYLEASMSELAHFTHILRGRGLRVTGQRLAVYRALTEHGRHLTAEEVHARAGRALSTISLTTVYKILHELVELGEARRVDLGDGSARFDPNTEPHAHLVCRRCGRAEDLPAGDYHVGVPAVAARGYRVLDHAVIFYGLCPRCRAAVAEAPGEVRRSTTADVTADEPSSLEGAK